jgi:hypothetical protein
MKRCHLSGWRRFAAIPAFVPRLTILYNILYQQRPILSLHPAKMERRFYVLRVQV